MVADGSSPFPQQPAICTHFFSFHVCKIHFNTVPPFNPKSFSCNFSHQNTDIALSPISATCLAHLILRDLINLTMSGEQYKAWSSRLCNFVQPPFISSLVRPNIALSALFPYILSQCYSVTARGRDSHPYKTAGEIVLLCMLLSLYPQRDEKCFIEIVIRSSDHSVARKARKR